MFLNSNFGSTIALSGIMPVPNYAVAGFGISGLINPIDRLYFQLAIFDGNPYHIGSDGKDDNIHETDFRWHREEGLLISLEAGYKLEEITKELINSELATIRLIL